MNRKTLAALILLMPFLLAFSGPTYIGAKKCKICHKVEFASWQKLAHAKAFERLSAEEKGKAECLKCHATGGHAKFPGVQCEACHGPGSGYKSLKVMKDSAKSRAAGLVMPLEATCKGCHEKAPHEVPTFNFAEMKERGIHEKKSK